MLHVRFEEAGGALLVTPFHGRIGAELAPELREAVVEAAHGRRLVVLSLLHVRAVDASGLAALVSILKSLAPGGELDVPAGGYGSRSTSAVRMKVDWVRAWQGSP